MATRMVSSTSVPLKKALHGGLDLLEDGRMDEYLDEDEEAEPKLCQQVRVTQFICFINFATSVGR